MSEPFVIYQGTFDPFTNGHLEIAKQAVAQFGRVRILLLVNPDKQPLFTVAERKEMIAAATAELKGISIDSDTGLLVDYMRAHGVHTCVRGVRNEQDRLYEMHNHQLSHALYPALQTVLLTCSSQWKDVSSSAVKAACLQGKLPRGWVSEAVLAALKQKFPDLQVI